MFGKINDTVHKKSLSKKSKSSNDDDNDSPPKNKGKLLVYATCTPADITFPADLKLLNKVRETIEEIIDALHRPPKGFKKKSRTYRRVARENFFISCEKQKIVQGQTMQSNPKTGRVSGKKSEVHKKLSKCSSFLLVSSSQIVIAVSTGKRSQRLLIKGLQ